MYHSEGKQLIAFVNFVILNNLAGKLRRKDWSGFARRYNGSGYKVNQYDTKLKKAYYKHKININ